MSKEKPPNLDEQPSFDFDKKEKPRKEEKEEEIVPKRDVSPEVEAKVKIMRKSKEFEQYWNNEEMLYWLANESVGFEKKKKKPIRYHGDNVD